eukprot:14299191-Ditylum_brightwellii.AAC.1
MDTLKTKKPSSVATSKNHNVGASTSLSIKEMNQLLVTSNSWDDAETVCSFQFDEEGDHAPSDVNNQKRGKASDITKSKN